VAVGLHTARREWREASARLEAARDDRVHYRRLLEQLDVVHDELRRRVGQTFTLAELARAYAGADDWARDVLDDAREEDAPPPDAATITDAAFQLFARGASDYTP